MATLRTCAKYLDPNISSSWLWGGTGYAFSLTIHEGLCPSGPYVPVGKFDALLPNVGVQVEQHTAKPDAPDFAARRAALFEIACKAIDAGYPVMGWSLRHIDWYPIFGYRDNDSYLFRNHDGRRHPYPHAKLGERAPGGLAIVAVVKLTEPAEPVVTVRDAFVFALKMAAGKYSDGKYSSGFAGYDAWIHALQHPAAPPKDATCFGHAFNAACWGECRRRVVRFLVKARERLGRPDLNALLQEAETHYQSVSEEFKTLSRLFPCQPGCMAPMMARFRDDALREQGAQILMTARDVEEQGVKAIARLAVALGAAEADTLLASCG